ncbi:MAG: hypothetical protein ACRESF_08185 [Pseudomonas sp.]
MNRTEGALLLWTVSAALYALYAAVFLPPEMSVSCTLAHLVRRYPIIPLALGLLLGHWFWSQE